MKMYTQKEMGKRICEKYENDDKKRIIKCVFDPVGVILSPLYIDFEKLKEEDGK